MKRALEYAKIATVTFGVLYAVALLWFYFIHAVNPFLAQAIVDGERTQSYLHLLAADILTVFLNYPLPFIWSLAAFGVFCWASQKDERGRWRRITLAIYLLPLVTVTGLVIAAAIV